MNQAFVLANSASESQTSSAPQETFFQFIWKNKINRRYLLIAAAGTIVQFMIFKMLYPFPDFFSDSYSYLYAAYANLDVSIWPIGYSKFLRWFHFITYSDTALIGFQYFLLILSSLYFFFTINYLYSPLRFTRIILFIFLFFNPLFLYLCNYVNSDPLFAALSLIWITELLWIIYRPKWYRIITQAILLFSCFTIRNNAYYYPLISILTFVLSRYNMRSKIAGILFPFILIIPFIIHTRNETYKITGTKQFSLFTGWQLANNALYMFEYTDSARNLSPQAQEVDKLARQFYSARDSSFHRSLNYYVGNFFIRENYAPLKRYMNKHYKISDDETAIIAWGKSSVIFTEYGNSLIKRNLRAYIWEYMLPNARNYFLPPLEKLEIYNLGLSRVDPIAKFWFHYESERVSSISKTLQGTILSVFPALFLGLNTYLLATFLAIWLFEKYRFLSTDMVKSALIVVSFWILNFLFCVSATIIVFRYEFLPMIICLTFSLLSTEWFDKKTYTNISDRLKSVDKNKIKLSNQY